MNNKDLNLPAAAASRPPCKYTVGPIDICAPGYADYEGQCIVLIGDDRRIAIVLGEDEEAKANADLFAAAPELLNALKSVWALIESGQLQRNTSSDSNPDFVIRQIPFVMALKKMQMAIDKAEGRSSQGSPDGTPPQATPEVIR